MTEETAEEKLARYEFVLDAYVRELTTLREENARLKEGATALTTLQNFYRNSDLPESLRTKAAGLALQHEVPRLLPEKAPLDLVAEPVIPLADLITARRARQDRLCPQSADGLGSSELPIELVPIADSRSNGSSGNGSSD
jgi:hypothetical protein